ncbi:acyltransferase family protein [uncultured Prevotella sp.]|uniref:acyltransferase family protein n=1 Tax=uncultured Prevotella sp. TaxID=159272 RepID=UPI00262445B7|nr:acyltransferase family protein [uncultured Prevotella sp.]
MIKQRDLSLDLLRIVACVMVVMMHSPIPSDNSDGIILSSLSYFTAPCIGLFFMVSGALILPPQLLLKAIQHCRSYESD